MCWYSYFAGAYSMGAVGSFVLLAFCMLLGEQCQLYARMSVLRVLARAAWLSIFWVVTLPCMILGIR